MTAVPCSGLPSRECMSSAILCLGPSLTEAWVRVSDLENGRRQEEVAAWGRDSSQGRGQLVLAPRLSPTHGLQRPALMPVVLFWGVLSLSLALAGYSHCPIDAPVPGLSAPFEACPWPSSLMPQLPLLPPVPCAAPTSVTSTQPTVAGFPKKTSSLMCFRGLQDELSPASPLLPHPSLQT